MFPPELELDAFRASNGEFGWTREQIPRVVKILRGNEIGILGGELWWVRDGFTEWVGHLPQRHGPPAVYCWETRREPGESWAHFIERGASDAQTAVQRWPMPEDLLPDLPGRILYNLTWATEAEYKMLSATTLS
jgi:hypothetical protein